MKKIFEEICGDETTLKGGYVMSNGIYFIATIYLIDHSIKSPKLFNNKRQTFIYNDEQKAIDFAKSWRSF